MPKLDLLRLERERKLEIAEEIPADAPLWKDMVARWTGPLEVRAEAQKVLDDVLVRGRFAGEAQYACRRCLTDVRVPIDEEFTLFFRSGATPLEAEEEESYPLPERDNELELAEPLREQVLLTVPQFAVCDEACTGLCPHCGTNLNERSCDCVVEDVDPRWSALRDLKSE